MAALEKLAVLTALGGAAAAGAAAGVRVAGTRIASRTDERLDPLLTVPGGVEHHRVASHDGGSVHVAERGEGPAVLLLHGVTLQWDVWSPLLHLLGGDHRVLAWDMRGHGESHAGEEGVSLQAVAADMTTVLEELDVADAVVVGHSMGGMALGRFLVDHADTAQGRVRHGVFLATSAAPMFPLAHEPESIGQRAATLVATRGMGSRVRYDWRAGNLSRVVLRRSFGRRASGAAVEQLRAMAAEMAPDSLTEAARAIVLHDLRGALGANEVPSSVITGTHDILTPPRHGRILAEALGGAEFHLLDGIGHQVMQEDPFVLAEHIRARAGGPAASPVGAGAAHPSSGTGGDGGPDAPSG